MFFLCNFKRSLVSLFIRLGRLHLGLTDRSRLGGGGHVHENREQSTDNKD